MGEKRYTAIILSAGKGSRMNSSIHKQYMDLAGRPVICHTIERFENSTVTDIVLVTGAGEIDYCKQEIVEKYHYHKVRHIVEGGKERYHSVMCGLEAAQGADYVLIHDGARPFATEEIIRRVMECVQQEKACVVGMPVKDTIKIADDEGYVSQTPNRNSVWMIQTPQAFSYDLILGAYQKMMMGDQCGITDDAMVAEQYSDVHVKLIEGSYENIKITTPEDLVIAESFCKNRAFENK